MVFYSGSIGRGATPPSWEGRVTPYHTATEAPAWSSTKHAPETEGPASRERSPWLELE